MALALAVGAIAGLVGFLWYAVARDRGPSPEEVALAYEHAWDRLDFATLWDLSGDELRDGMTRAEFVSARRDTHAQGPHRGRLASRVEIDSVVTVGEVVHVVTAVVADGGCVRNDVLVERRRARWQVVGYSLHREPDAPSARA